MIIDIVVILLALFATIRGLRMGLIVGICSYLALIVGLAAGIKLSAVVANLIGTEANITGKWMPFVCFLIIFALVALLVRLLSSWVQKLSEKLSLGIVNRIGGVLFFVLIYLSAIAILLFYVNQLQLLPQRQVEKSVTFPYIKLLGTYAVDALGNIIPTFKNMFKELELFFETASQKIK